MESVGVWFTKEVFTWRRIASIIWSCLLLPPVLGLFYMAASLSLRHPYTWIVGMLWFPFTPSVWFYCSLLIMVQIGLMLYDTSFYTVTPHVATTRMAMLWGIVAPPRLLHMLIHAMSSGFVAWCFVSVLGGRFAGLTKSCESHPVCLNEHHLFVVLSGVFVGAMYSLNHFWHSQQYLAFPIIQQAKFFSVKSCASSVLAKSFRAVLSQLRAYYILYYLFGSGPKHWIVTSLGIEYSDDTAVNSIVGLFDLSLFWQSVLCGTFINFLWSMGVLLFSVYSTEPYQFPMDSSIEEDQHCLHQALGSSTHPIVQYLGFLDLCLLSRYSVKRRNQLFSLSLPGGHAHNWNKIVTECLSSLDHLTTSVTASNKTVKVPIRQVSGDRSQILPTPRRKLHSSREESLHYTSFGQQSFTSISSPFHDDSLLHRTGHQTLNGSLNKTSPTNGHATVMQAAPPSGTKTTFFDQLKKRPIIAYFLEDLPDVASRKVFADCQKQIWSLEALSNLVVASYTEDMYGVVQKSLPDIVTTMLSLQEAIDKHFKSSPNISRKSYLDSGLDASLRFALKTTLKSSIYRIITTFEQHLRKIPLSTEHGRLLEFYLENRE